MLFLKKENDFGCTGKVVMSLFVQKWLRGMIMELKMTLKEADRFMVMK